jgi:hypothetical protein
MASIQEDFLARVERFLTENGTLPTKFGVDAAGDPRFVFDLRQGRSCGAKLMDKICGWMAEREKGRAA